MQAWKQVSNSIDPFPAGGDGDPVLRAEVADVAEWQWPNTRLMRCCAKLDRRTEAIGAYRRLRRTLSVTLGPHPSANSEKPYRSLRAGWRCHTARQRLPPAPTGRLVDVSRGGGQSRDLAGARPRGTARAGHADSAPAPAPPAVSAGCWRRIRHSEGAQLNP